MAFTDNPIINSPFDRPQWHFELDEEGQPTGKKLPGRRESTLSFPKIQSGGIRAVRQNQRIIQCDVRDHLPACSLHT